MKTLKLSLIASLAVAGLTSAQADTLAEAFANGKVSGEIKSQFFQKKDDSGKVSIWTNGGNLSYETGSFYGLKAGVTFQASTVTADDLDNNSTAYDSDQNVSGAVASQAYLAYTAGNTTAKVGRQFISTPLVAGSGSRIFRESFEGIVLANTDLPNTTLVAAYVGKFQGRTDSTDNSAPKFTDKFVVTGGTATNLDGAYTLYAKNNSVENLTLEAQYADVDVKNSSNDVKVFYAAASYNLKPFTIEAQTYQSDNGNATNSDGKAYAVNLTANFDALSLGAAFSTVDNEADVIAGLGNGADNLYTWSDINGGNYTAGTDAYKLSAGYAVNSDLSLDLMYASWKTPTKPRASETDYIINYKFDKNLSSKFVLAAYDEGSFDYRSRLYVSYKF